jgi:hypothetical protein
MPLSLQDGQDEKRKRRIYRLQRLTKVQQLRSGAYVLVYHPGSGDVYYIVHHIGRLGDVCKFYAECMKT